jgi:hypothetical protein
VAESSGSSLHAGIAAKRSQRDKLEHLARYVSSPPVATERLSLTKSGHVRSVLKTPYCAGLSGSKGEDSHAPTTRARTGLAWMAASIEPHSCHPHSSRPAPTDSAADRRLHKAAYAH